MTVAIHPLEVEPPDISAWRDGNCGIEYVHSFDSGRPGPHVLVGALMHGNEICGAIAVDWLLRMAVRPRQGRLTFAFHNVDAYARFGAETRSDTRFVDEDMNRVWEDTILDGRDSAEIRRARALRPLLRDVDLLLDIHSMGTRCEPMMLCHGLAKERRFLRAMGYPRNVVCGSGHVKGRRLIEYAPFNDPANDKVAILIECGQHWARSAADVAKDTALHFLAATGAVEPAFVQAHRSEPPPIERHVYEVVGGVSAETDAFRFVRPFIGLEHFPRRGSLVALDGKKPVETPEDGCVLIMPSQKPKKGERVLRFAREIGWDA